MVVLKWVLGIAMLSLVAGSDSLGTPDERLPLAAARAGDSKAQYCVAWTYFNGCTRAIDRDTAQGYMAKSASAGYPLAQAIWGYFQLDGKFAAKDEAAGFALAKASALAGDGQGQCIVGFAKERGTGTPVDLTEALMWYLLGACQSRDVEAEVLSLRRRMSEAQQLEAARRAVAWPAAHPGVEPKHVDVPMALALRARPRPTKAITWLPGAPSVATATKAGGVPWWPRERARPLCPEGHPLSFVAQVRLGDVPGLEADGDALLSFHVCDHYYVESGETTLPAHDLSLFLRPTIAVRDQRGHVGAALIRASHPRLSARVDHMGGGDMFEFPLGGVRGHVYSVIDVLSYGLPDSAYRDRDARNSREYPNVTGAKLGGWPSWDHAQWPTCDEGRPMRFVLQLDRGLSLRDLPWRHHICLFVCPPACRHRHARLVE